MSAKAYDKKTAAFAGFIIQNLPDGLTDDIMNGWMQNPAATKRLLAELVPQKKPIVSILNEVIPESLRLTIDYGQPLETMIAAGKYDWKHGDITAQHFPHSGGDGIVEVEACLFYFNRMNQSKDVIRQIKAADEDNPWSAGQIEHVLAFGAMFPGEQRKFPIIGLGSVTKIIGSRQVPGLWEDRSERILNLTWFGTTWSEGCRFLAVRPVSNT